MPAAQKLIPNYLSASIALSFGGFLNGYDTGSIGGIVHMHQFADSLGKMSSFVLGITVSMVMLTAVVPSLLTGTLSDKHGRLKIIMPGAVLCGIGAILQGTAFQLAQFILGRAVSGVGQGMFYGSISVYITEIAPLRKRGRLAAMPQFMATLGVCVGYFCCYGTAGTESSLAWRLPYIIEVSVAAALALVCLTLPESPRWLVLQGRGDEARTALTLLDFDMAEAQRDFLSATQEQPSLSNRQSFALLFRRGYRSRTLLALFLCSAVQLSGIDAITYYAPALFSQAGISAETSSLVASGVSSITMLLVSIPAFMLADRWGRRTSTISGGIVLTGLMFLIGSLYATGSVKADGAARWVVIVSVFLFGMVFCGTWAIVGKIYASEIMPGNTRAAGNSVGMAFSFFSNWLVALITPILLGASAYGAYFLFGTLALMSVVIFTIYMPETRGRSLEDIQGDFQRPSRTFFSTAYQFVYGRYHRRDTPSASSSGRSSDEIVEMERMGSSAGATSSVASDSVPRSLRVAAI